MTKGSEIHPTAIIDEGVEIGEGVTVEAYAVIKKNVVLKEGVVIKSHAYLEGHTEIGERTTVYPFASIGAKTQDLKFRGEKTFVKIGKECEIRECVTINASCKEGTVVSVGDRCLIMAYCHVAHNCSIGDDVIMSNNATLAGHVTVGRFAVIGGFTPIHQFVRIGAHAMVGGMSRVTHDIPPYTLGGGIPYKFGGINRVGLTRRQFPLEVRTELGKAYRLLYRSGKRLDEALDAMRTELTLYPEVEEFITFCATSERGILGLQGVVPEEHEKSEPSQEKLLSVSSGQ